jgi:hypothetical protein
MRATDTAQIPPAIDPALVAPAAAGEVGARADGHDNGGPEVNEEHFEPTDPHPDTPDDFDEDASSPRQSEEAVPEDDD